MASGLERFVLALALLVPLGIAGVSATRLAEPFRPTTAMAGDNQAATLVHRPAASEPDPPPTLAVPTPTPVPPTPTPAPPTPQPTPTPRGTTTYTVQPGDQLKYIAANHGVSISTILSANDVANPDNLRVGQTLTIPPGP
jgi:nucleoid-associated protein YgaU